MSVMDSRSLFDPAFLRSLERLRMNARALGEGRHRAERKSRRLGASLEFAEHRDYTFGDDPRRLDWNAFARLDRLYVKLLHDEEDLHVIIVVDASGSMQWRPPDQNDSDNPKLDHARRLAAALACIGLASQHRVTIGWVGESLGPWTGPLRGTASLHAAVNFLKNPPANRNLSTRLAAALGETATLIRGRSLVMVISDFLDPDGFEAGLARLAHKHSEVVALQITHPLELDPKVDGTTRLTDVETGESLILSAQVTATYRERRTAFDAMLAQWCARRAITHLQCLTELDPLDVLRQLIRKGVLSQ